MIVRAMLDAIAGAVPVKVHGSVCQHSYVDTELAGLKITFFMRDGITRVASAQFPDGATVDYEGEKSEEWIPPRELFSSWWARMGEEARTEKELQKEHATAHRKKQDAQKSGIADPTLEHALLVASGRLDIYNPFSYLTIGQQEELEDLLCQLAASNSSKDAIDSNRLERCHELANEIVARSERRGEKLASYDQELYYLTRGICDQNEWHFIVQLAQQCKEAIDEIVRETDFLDPSEGAKMPLDAWEWERRIFSVTYRKREMYPRYQFGAGEPLSIVAEVLKGFAGQYGEIDRWKVAAWMHYPNGYITAETPVGKRSIAPKDALDRPVDIRAALRHRTGTYVA